ncbi:MAG TPA: phospho-sugar mutase [Polyangiaceae bacterium]|nr:phospho-sugar mutase [Polyangiaceae bacterium]
MDVDREALLAEARAWILLDPDPETRRELAALVDTERMEELGDRFGSPLKFGTAGLRGVVGAGPSRMNRAVVERATRAVAEYLLDENTGDAKDLVVVVGFDARPTSRDFADAAIRVLGAYGVPARYFAEPCPTPLVAYAARELSAAAAIVITASHNPAEYNGYKLYGKDAVQIVPPVDAEIERRMRAPGGSAVPAVPPAPAVPISEALVERYLARIDSERPHGNAQRSLSIVYTPLHGVGGALATRALARAGFTRVAVVPEQAAPDGAFPTARSPNPEDPAALALALSLAAKRNADVVLANDPDADRLAVCVPAPSGHRPLSGNQIGVLLADFVLRRAPRAPRPLVVSSIVSSPMLADVAAAYGARHETTLTGFKWIWTCALELEETEGVRFVFGYEEAIGYSIGRSVRDKDGINAAVWFAELAAELAAEGETVWSRLAALHRRHGLWASAQHGVTRRGAGGAREIAASLDSVVRTPPASLAGRGVANVVDFREGGQNRPPWLPNSPLVLLELERGGRVLLRPSGTEPKLKIYADLRRDVAAADSLVEAEAALEAAARRAAAELAACLGF